MRLAKEAHAVVSGHVISYVIPCLNEESTLGLVLDEIHGVMKRSRYAYEIVVADNGSTDSSRSVAAQHGATVVDVPERGYGSALHAGILAATGDIIAMLDADFTYSTLYVPDMVDELLGSGSSMVMGSRLRGSIEQGAMPFLHRRLGTPVLTFMINRMLGSDISDCNSGMRVFRKQDYEGWDLRSPGMEYASEMIVSTLLNGGKIREVPIDFRKDRRDRAPHLKTWHDGMRHLLFILSRAPKTFILTGTWVVGITGMFALISLFGPLQIGVFRMFGYHTTIIAILFGFFGAQALSQGLVLDVKQRRSAVSRALLGIPEGTLFGIVVGVILLVSVLLVFLLAFWSVRHFHNLPFLNPSLFVVYVVTIIGSLTMGLMHAHVVKRVR